MRYVVIGDSIPRGFRLGPPTFARRRGERRLYGVPLGWFDRPGRAYPAMVADALRDLGTPVALDERLARSGAPSGDFWRNGPTEDVRRVMDRPADLVTVTLGGNDLITHWFPYLWALWPARAAGTVAPAARERLLERLAPRETRTLRAAAGLERALTGLLGWLADGRAGRVMVTTYAAPDSREAVAAGFTRPVNGAIRAAAAAVPGVEVVDLEPLFAGHDSHAARGERWLRRSDGVHPNRLGQRAIAAAILARLGDAPAG